MVSYPSSSLEDCLTNVVSWTEFTGINWICLTSQNPVEHANNCTILKAYNECQKLRIYSFWRRRPFPSIVNKNAPKSPIITGKEPKELWIFWYENAEPPLIKELLENGLIQDQSGSFASNGLDYKIRILMYDALHRILESGCIAKRFVRFGRWFCQPLSELITTRKKILPRYMIAFQFTFCTFGNQVCISPRFQRQPTLLSITKKHLLQKIRQKVILAPWGIVGHILPEQTHFDLDKSDTAESENEKSTEDIVKSFRGLYSTPEKDKTATKKQLEEILKKYYEDFLFSVGYPDLPSVTSDLPKVLAIEIDGISTYWPTVLMAICIDDLKDDDEPEEEDDASDIELIDPPSTSPSSYYAGCRAAQRLFEDALLPPPDRHDERLSLMDCTQKELCCCKSCNISEAPFDALPSISPAGILNPNTPHILNPNTPHEPPSVPPTSIESVHSTSGDLKHLRRPPRLRYKQPQFSFQLDYQKDRPKSPKIEAEVEEARRNDFAPTTSWAHATTAGEYPINHMGVNGGYTVALSDSIWNVLPIFRGDQEWDETQAIQRPASPYTPITVVTPEYSQYNTDDESMTMEQDFQRREKPHGVSSYVREDDPIEPMTGQNGEHSILRSLLVSTDESSPTTPASDDDRKSATSSSSYDSDSGLNERQQWRPRKRANLGVTIDCFLDEYKRRRIYMSNLPMVDIGRIGVPKIKEYFEPGEVQWPDYLDEDDYYYPDEERGGNEYSDFDDEDDEISPPQPNYRRQMNEHEIDRYAAPIERVPNPMASSTAGSAFPQQPMNYDELENFVPQPSTFEDAMMLDSNDLMEVNSTSNDLLESHPSTSVQESNATVEGTKSLNEALRQAIKPITEIPENEEIAESTKRAMEAFQKRNPFPLSKKDKQKQQLEQEELLRDLISPDPEAIRAISRRTLSKVYHKIHEQIDPMFDMIDNIHEILPDLNIYKQLGCAPMIQCKEFYGDPFKDNVRIQPNMFDTIDDRNARVEKDPLKPPPKYVKKTNVKSDNTKVVEKINLQKAEEKEHALRYGMMQAAQNNFNQQQQQQHQQQQQQMQYHPQYQQHQQQQQHRQAMFMNQRHHSFMSNSPQMNGMMFNNSIPPQTPSPMSTPRYIQPHSNTITVCGSNTGGSVQMADMAIGMNGFPGMGGGRGSAGPPPITSTPNSMMPYGPSPQMNSNNSFMPPYPMMPNGYNQPTPRMSSTDNLLMNAFDPPIRNATPELSGLQMFEKIQKSVGFIFVALLRDSILDLHYDAVYDSCPLCSCTESIRTNEFGIYLSIPNDVQVADSIHYSDEKTAELTAATRFGGFFVKNRDIESCFCAFSAVRHRILCYANSNLFTDDIREATGGPVVVEVDKPELKWFNPLKSADWKFIDVFRWYLLGHDLSAYIRTGYYIGDCPSLERIEEYDRLVSPKKEYIVNGIDQGELDYIVSTVFDASALGQMIMNERASRQQQQQPSGDPRQPPALPELTSLVHPWAVQLADKTSQLNEIEYCGFMPKIVGILEDTAQLVRSPTTPGNIVEGPLTWKSLHHKATKMYKTQKTETEEDTSHNPEPIPNIVVGSEKDLILTSPTAIWAWDRYGLAPYSWPKNVLYLTVIPDHSYATEKTKSFADNSLITEKCKIFLEDLSSVYEKNRLGRHLPLPPKVKDQNLPLNNGIIKIPLQNLNNSNDQKSLVQKLEYFVTQYLQLITRIFGEMDCFDKRTFLEAVYRDFYADHHSSAVPTDSAAMPPPAAPQQQPLPNSTSSPMPPTSDPSFDSPLFNHQQTPQSIQQQNVNSPLPNMFDGSNLNPRTPDPSAQAAINNNNFGADDPLSATSIFNGVDELAINDEENPALPHVLVIYIVNPFFFGSANTQEYFSKLVTVKLLKSFNNILSNLDHVKKPRVQVELIDIRTIFDYSAYSNDPLQEYFHPLNQSTVNDPMASINALRKLAFTVYSQPRQLHVEGIRDLLSKSMTRFGPFSQATDILDNLMANPSSTYRIPTAPFILAPKSSNYEITPQGKLKLKNPDEKVLFVTYCLVKDDFLIVSVTDDRGELNDTKVISISRRTTQKSQKHSSQISLVVDAIQRLWAYIQGVMSLDTKNWRLVIGRFGKIGHGEFKAWTSILAKKNLQSYNSILKGKDKELQTPAADKPSILTASTSCKTCSLNPGFVETPALIAACLVSTEADAYFKVFPELLADQKQKAQRILPNDYSITHIMVFPTSPCISSEVDAGIAEDKEEDFAFFAPGDDDNNAGMEMDLEIDINDLGEVSSATTTIANQPIAMGFMISTAPALDVPDWFWSQCPNAKNDTPVHLRSALHISVPHVQQNDDVMLAMAENHPLESNKTEEVLTYILQTYNELSWLNIDIISGQRKSCLPVHIQKLLVLYNSMNTTFY